MRDTILTMFYELVHLVRVSMVRSRLAVYATDHRMLETNPLV